MQHTPTPSVSCDTGYDKLKDTCVRVCYFFLSLGHVAPNLLNTSYHVRVSARLCLSLHCDIHKLNTYMYARIVHYWHTHAHWGMWTHIDFISHAQEKKRSTKNVHTATHSWMGYIYIFIPPPRARFFVFFLFELKITLEDCTSVVHVYLCTCVCKCVYDNVVVCGLRLSLIFIQNVTQCIVHEVSCESVILQAN